MSEETKKIIRQVKINDSDYNIYAEHAQDSDKTTYDSYGNLIKVSDYETKNDAEGKLTAAKDYTDTKIQETITQKTQVQMITWEADD